MRFRFTTSVVRKTDENSTAGVLVGSPLGHSGDMRFKFTTNVVRKTDKKSSTAGVLVGSQPTFLPTVCHSQSRLAEESYVLNPNDIK